MAKNDFRVTSTFKIILRICVKNIEFCGKISKFLPKRCLFIFCNIYSKDVKATCVINYVENKISNSTPHNPTSKHQF